MDGKQFIEKLKVGEEEFLIYRIGLLEESGLADIDRLPFSIRILVENLLRKLDGRVVTEEDLLNAARWSETNEALVEIPYHPSRVLMQDFTGVPAVVDLAAMREAMVYLGRDPGAVNPLVPVDLVIDHSVQSDYYGCAGAAALNVKKEYERNSERYALLKWAQNNFNMLRVAPPGSGICHQVNFEHLSGVVMTQSDNGVITAFPETFVGLDSHTTMINGLGVMGWGVGGIEAEAVMLGQPYYMALPEVIGVRLTGALAPGVTATDLVLCITEMLRQYNVVEKFVEFTGPGVKGLSLPDRATIANMAPEYGATLGLFPVDEITIEYLRETGRDRAAELTEVYCRANSLFYSGSESPVYTDVIEFDLSRAEPSLAGPSRPKDRIPVPKLKDKFAEIKKECKIEKREPVELDLNGTPTNLTDGSVVIASITSCTNTSNPTVLMGAGLLAKNAVKSGLRPPPYVKTILAPGSRVVARYLQEADLMPYLEALGFHTAGFGCMTCIGNSGPLHPAVEKAIDENNLNTAAVLSGNRNFEARIHPKIRSNFLASPMLVVAYALAGRVDVDLTSEPVGIDPNGSPVYLADIWPSDDDITGLVTGHVKRSFFEEEYGRLYEGDQYWSGLPDVKSLTYSWDPDSTYIKNPPYFDNFSMDVTAPSDIEGARVLVVVGDSITTDHISPAGAISKECPAGEYLMGKSVTPDEFNSYGARRGNHEVMMRGTFGNIRLKNLLEGCREGGFTCKFPEQVEMYVYEAAMAYQESKTPLIVLGGNEYGAGSSRDWAAKGTSLLGVKAVIARSFERIHRSNLVGMGVLPLQFKEGQDFESLGLDGTESYTIKGVDNISPRAELEVTAVKTDGSEVGFKAEARLNTAIEVDYYRQGGIMPYVLRKMASGA